ncbi:MAG: N(4)-(beta-N-acetylglucosaminyl)-L-asparaginase [Verrucomicrobia bacterium]|nr:N(4)-(beta-N-acetylglucosaminyl)-L-asparaginase [Verrucomicrobiota bacterium]
MSRRKFVRRTAIGVLGGAALSAGRAAETISDAKGGEKPLLVSTWNFGKAANDAGLKILLQGGSILDAAEQGIWVVESSGNGTVGLSGGPNAAGIVQLDACIMYGPGHKAGSVAALEGIRHPISAARRVMEKTRHVMLAGEGARMFALEEGLESIEVNSHERYQAWLEKRLKQKEPPAARKSEKDHDTIALLVLGTDGNIAGGCSTSGLGGKLPGRVGDSPILGSGLYVDNEVGAAGATGLGENVMRYCGSFMVVEYMRQGLHPTEACQETIRRIVKQEGRGANLSINFIALDKSGRAGGAGSDGSFSFSVTTQSSSRVVPNPGVGKV